MALGGSVSLEPILRNNFCPPPRLLSERKGLASGTDSVPRPYVLLYVLYDINSMCVIHPRGQVKSLTVHFFKVTEKGEKGKNPLKSNI